MAAIELPHDLTPLGFPGWFATAVYYRARAGAWTHTFAHGRDGLTLDAEAGTPGGALEAMFKRIGECEALYRRHTPKRLRKAP